MMKNNNSRVYLKDKIELYVKLKGRHAETPKSCSCSYKKLSVRLDKAWFKYEELYTSFKHLSVVQLYLSSLMKILYLFFKKIALFFAERSHYFEISAEDQYEFVFSHKGEDYYRENETMKNTCTILFYLSTILFLAFLTITCMFWVLSYGFLFISFIWLFETDLRFESDYFVKINYLRRRVKHYREKLEILKSEDAKFVRNKEKLSEVIAEIVELIDRKLKADNDRYGHVSPQTLVDTYQKEESSNIIEKINQLIMEADTSVDKDYDELFETFYKTEKEVRIKLMDENASIRSDEIKALMKQEFLETHFDKITADKNLKERARLREFMSNFKNESTVKEIKDISACFGNVNNDLIHLIDEIIEIESHEDSLVIRTDDQNTNV